MPKVDEATFLEYFSEKILLIAIPVVITLLIDGFLTRFIEQTHDSMSMDRSFTETLSTNSGGVSVKWAIIIAFIFIGMVILVTALLLVCYYYGCMKILFVWMVVSVSIIMSLITWSTFRNVPVLLNLPFDYITLVIFFLNLVIVSNLAVFWRAPAVVTQIVMVIISILIALVFLNLPDWTVWILLGLLVIYDCCVVLCPHGLLKMIIEKSEERGDALPALIYSSAAYYGIDHPGDEYEGWEERQRRREEEEEEESSSSSSSSDKELDVLPDNEDDLKGTKQPKAEKSSSYEEEEDNPLSVKLDDTTETTALPNSEIPEASATSAPEEDEKKKKRKKKKKKRTFDKDEEGIKLGLGDFVFYGILITRAARIGWDIIILCVLAVILGLSITLLCLAKFQRALPALPFSLVLGTIFFITGSMTFRPFALTIRRDMLAF